MKNWSADHPKAGLMSRKRSAILAAAKAAFLEAGYGGASMEGIAKRANVSIMTLYRHASSKDDLFAAVVANACAPTDEDDATHLNSILTLPLADALFESAVHLQAVLTAPDNLALLRIVLAETNRFPELAELTYGAYIGRLEHISAWMLSEVTETSTLGAPECKRLGKLFLETLVGPDMLRLLFGLPGLTEDQRRQRAGRARDEVLRELSIQRARREPDRSATATAGKPRRA